MGIPVTNPQTIRAAMYNLIEAITPTYLDMRDSKWSRTNPGEDPSGPTIRRFRILNGIARETFDGIHGGGGIGMNFDMTIRVAYGGLEPDKAEELISEDFHDLRLLIHPLTDGGTTDGLLPMQSDPDFDYFEDDDGYLVADFTFEIHYKGREE